MAIKKIKRIILGYKNENKPIPPAPQKCPPPKEILIVTMVAITWSSKLLLVPSDLLTHYPITIKDPLKKNQREIQCFQVSSLYL